MPVRFDDFELDAEQCRLCRAGEPVRLEKLPLDLLILLVGRHGELVKREEIAASLWGSETFVDAEHGINTCVRKIRGALGDDPNHPRYLETVVRRGYRFTGILIVERVVPVVPSAVPVLAAPSAPPVIPPATFPQRHARFWTVGFIVLLFLGAISAIAWRGSREVPRPFLRWTPLTKEVHTFTRLGSDGSHVYWTEYTNAGCQPYAVPATGGESMPVRSSFRNAALIDVSRDGHMMINPRENCKDTVIQGPLWEVALASGETRRIGDLFGQDAAYSPDGRQIAVAKGNVLWIANRDGSSPQRLAVLPSLIWTMHWSPDGKLLRFALFDGAGSRFRLWELPVVAGAQAQPLLSDWHDSSEKLGGVWINARDFLFSATRRGSIDIWMMHASAAPGWWQTRRPAVERVTAGPLDFEGPATIPGRDEVAVIGTHRQGELQRYDSSTKKFVPFVKGLSAEMVDFSRDGLWMTYVSYPDGALWRSHADGSEPLQLTRFPLRAGMPRISPDGSQIAFTGESPGEQLRTYLIPFAGGTPKALTGAKMSEVSPTWSPDGKQLLIRSDQHGVENGTIFQDNVLQVVDVESGRIRVVPDSQKKFNQRWSPDGKWIIATPNNEQEIDILDLATNRWTVLAAMHGDYPSWSRDSKFVYFIHNDHQRADVYRISLATRRTERVASLANVDRAMNEVYSQWCGLAPDGSPLILRAADFQQIYALSFGSEKP